MAEVPPSNVGPEEARDLADRVLSGRAYLEASRPPSLRERVFDWIAEQFADLLNALSATGGRGITAWIVIGVFTAVIAYLLYRFTKGTGPTPKRQAASPPVIDVIAGHTAAEWLAQAEAAEAAGDWRVGVRCRHRWLAATLLGKGLISDRPGQTAGEIYQAVAAQRPDAQPAMQQATDLFKDTWYGWVEADKQSSDRFVALAHDVLAAVEQEPQAVPV